MTGELVVTQLPSVSMATREVHNSGHSLRDVRRFLLGSPRLSVELLEFGATVLAVKLLTADGAETVVTRGLGRPADYSHNPAYMGAVCGRYAGRIAGASYPGPSGRVLLSANQGANQLHGGHRGFSARLFSAQPFEREDRIGVDFLYTSASGEEGFPGALDVRVRYAIDAAMRLTIEYRATALDEVTPVNLTNHCYWNLSDAALVHDHEVELAARSVLELDTDLLPTGRSLPVEQTALDFSAPRTIGEAMSDLPVGSSGFDHCLHDFVGLNTPDRHVELPLVARVRDSASGRTMAVYTDQPLLVFYTGNALDGSAAHGGVPMHGGFCLECQQFPDAPNQPDFPSPFIGKGERYEQTTVYAFSVSS